MRTHIFILIAALFLPLVPVQAAPPSPVISFQGRLLDPVTGLAKPDGAYSATFQLYHAASGGSALWTETKFVTVANGFFTTLLGDTTTLDPANFDQYNIWLGITLPGDAEMVPRHRISYAPYSITALTLGGVASYQFVRSDTWGTLSANSAANPALAITQTTDQPALTATSQANSSGEAALKGIAGSASASTINSAAAVLGTSSNYRGVIGVSTNADGVFGWSTSQSGVNGQSLDGYGLNAYSSTNHAIYAYAASASKHALYASGSVAATKLVYNTARTHYFSIPGSEFSPRAVSSAVAYVSGYGNEGAYITAGGEYIMKAPVHLPDGATVTNLQSVLEDSTTAYGLIARLYAYSAGGGETTMAEISTGTANNAGILTYNTSAITAPVIDNVNYSYGILVLSSGLSWSVPGSLLKVKRVRVDYQISEAE